MERKDAQFASGRSLLPFGESGYFLPLFWADDDRRGVAGRSNRLLNKFFGADVGMTVVVAVSVGGVFIVAMTIRSARASKRRLQEEREKFYQQIEAMAHEKSPQEKRDAE